MKIAILHPGLDVKGGAERQVLQLAIGLQKLGHEITLYVSKLDKDNCFPELINKVKIIECGGYNYKDIKKSIIFSSYYMKKMAKAVLNSGIDYDLINCHNYPTTYAAYLIKKKKEKNKTNKKMSIVWMCNEPPFPPLYNESKRAKSITSYIYRLIVWPFLFNNQKIVKNIDQIVVLDKMNYDRIKMTYHRNSDIIHTGLDIPSNKIQNNKSEIDRYVILSTGRIDKNKRTEDAILAIAQLKDKIPNIILNIVGGGEMMDKMKKLVHKLGLDNYVKFYGRVSDEKLRELYTSCNIFLFTAENQSWGLVPLEAMSYKKPCLVSTGAGVSTVLDDEKCLKIEPKKPKEIAEKIVYLYDNPKIAEKLARTGEQFVKDNFSWDKYVDEMEKFFLSACLNINQK